MLILGSPFLFPPGTMISAIEQQGLTSGLKLCLDASDINSYSGAGQSWLDTSGNGYDFFRGTTSASQATDPTFHGVAGAQSSSEYWSFDGGDYFTYDAAVEAWMSNIHKNNAKFAIAAWVYCADFTDAPVIASTYSAPDPGFSFTVRATRTPRIAIFNASSTIHQSIAVSTVSANTWTFVAVSIDEAAGTGTLQTQASQEPISPTYSAPSASATIPMRIGAEGDGTFPTANGNRIASLAAWEGVALSSADLLSLYNTTKSKFGL